ncbi:MAG: hypothetical protein DWQ31_07095 [Planctomycetota bacterium]|nr:MAG: hypothetical protein DWQ31_07095 [Planctomycetota bacterium]
MPLFVRFLGGDRAGEVLTFDDDCTRVVLGRSPEECDVLFPLETTIVGREHCALVRDLGRYELRLNCDNPVYLDGELAIEGQELGPRAELQLGEKGPRLLVETRQNESLPSTADQGRRPGAPMLIREAGRTAAAGRRVGLIALILLAIAGYVGYTLWTNTNIDVEDTQAEIKSARSELGATQSELDEAQQRLQETRQQLRETRQLVELIEPKITNLRQLTQQQERILDDIASNVDRVDRRIRRLEPQLAAALKRATPSVYLVLSQNGRDVSPMATAWVVDRERGLLATNGHVAEGFRGAGTMVVRSTSDPPVTLEVESAETHPGYSQFLRLWYEYDPTTRLGNVAAERVASAGPACDVALLKVADPDRLAPALPLADADELGRLEPAYPVGYVGFPMEGIVLGGVNAQAPAPTRHMAYVTALTTYFGEERAPLDRRLLVQHAMPSAGGASGSPIINRDGKVVAVHNAGNVIGVTKQGRRIKSGANIQYGQRADLVRELLQGTADANQFDRRTQWERDIARFYRRRTDLEREIRPVRDHIFAQIAATWESMQTMSGNYRVNVVPEIDGVVTVAPRAQRSITIGEGGPCLAIAYATLLNVDIELELRDSRAGDQRKLIADQDNFRWGRSLGFEVADNRSLSAIVTCESQAADVVLRILRAERTRVPIEEKVANDLQFWRRQLRIFGGQDLEAGLVSEAEGKFPAPVNAKGPAVTQIELEIEEAGEYFAFVSVPGDHRVNLTVTHTDEGTEREFSAFPPDMPSANVAFDLEAATKVTFLVMGDEEDVTYQFRLYRGIPPSPPPV